MDMKPHAIVSEYDGAFKCLECQKSWGALPGHPEMPTFCEMSETRKRINEVEKQIRTLQDELSWLNQRPDA